ncbi:MAG: SGNH/GDSL hydrolase family protein [Phycicoccus sp.]|nr:SGNH/GDSL hydrolase family protein [Phycicoccus sp.]
MPDVDVTVVPTGGALHGLAPVEMAAFGDSSMAGVGVDEVKDTLPVQLAQRVADGAGRPVHVVCHARSGALTRDVLDRQLPLASRGTAVSVLVVGTNDVIHMTRPARLARYSGELLDALVGLGGPVVMSSLPEFRAMRALPEPLRSAMHGYGLLISGVQRRAAARRSTVRLVDVSGSVGREFVHDPSTMSADSIHPSATGYGRIADALAPTVLAVLRAAEPSGSAVDVGTDPGATGQRKSAARRLQETFIANSPD